jgi:hypothetical protein
MEPSSWASVTIQRCPQRAFSDYLSQDGIAYCAVWISLLTLETSDEYCSIRCRSAAYREVAAANRAPHPERVCAYEPCGQVFTPKKRGTQRIYCTQERQARAIGARYRARQRALRDGTA